MCVPDRFQVDLELEAVAIENDNKGTLVPVNDVSYNPGGAGSATGWNNTDLEFEDITNRKDRSLALKSVFRYYRVKFPINVKGYIDSKGNYNATISHPWKVKLEQCLVQTLEEDWHLAESQRRSRPAIIYGCRFSELDGDEGGNNVTPTDVAPYQTNPTWLGDDEEDIEVDNNSWRLATEGKLGLAEDHVVIFDNPIYIDGGSAAYPYYEPAVLILRCSCTLLDEHLFSPVRSYFWLDTGSGLDTLARCEVFSDLQVWHYWDEVTGQMIDNNTVVRKDAEYYLNGMLQSYQMTVPQTVVYAGLKRIELDGAIRHVTYKVSKSGCTTTANRNTERLDRVPSLTYRKMMNKIKAGLRGAQGKRETLHVRRNS
jgi:hypothetical protein